MTKQEFAILAKGMKAVYASPSFLPDSYALNIWFSLLEDLDYQTCSAAIQKHMQTSSHPPTIADIRKAAVPFPAMDENEAWSHVYNALRNSGYYSQEEWEKLPESVKHCVTPNELYRMALDEHINLSVESSNFKRTYRAKMDAGKEDALLSEKVRQGIAERRLRELQKGNQNENVK